VDTTFTIERIRSQEEIASLVHVRKPHKEVEKEILDMFVSSGALLKGHFGLESGQHSRFLTRFADIAGNRKYVDKIADRVIGELRDDKVIIDAILTQEYGGRVLAQRIASKLDKRIVLVETDEQNRPTESLINETTLYRCDRVLIVSDIATTGYGLRTMVAAARKRGALPVAIAIFATRNKEEMSRFEHEEGLKVYALADLAFEKETYGTPHKEANEKECEICREGNPAIPSWQI